MIIAIDGPAASGKGTLARKLASSLSYDYLDTGLLYRACARLAMDLGIDASDVAGCEKIALSLAVQDLARDDLRGETVGQAASRISAVPGVRRALLDFQRTFATNPPSGIGAILDGRDIGTVICPDADVKIYLVANPMTRAKRRHAEALAKGEASDLHEIASSIRDRDAREASRTTAPMIPAEDACILHTSELTRDEVLEIAIEAVCRASRASSSRRAA